MGITPDTSPPETWACARPAIRSSSAARLTPPEYAGCRHDTAHARELFAPLGALLRSCRSGALVRPGSALAALPRLPDSTRRGSRARRRHRHRARRRRAPPPRLPRHRARPERRDARRRAPTAREPGRARRGSRRVDAVCRRVLRPPDLHVPASVRRRSRRDARRARACRAPGGSCRLARVRRPPQACASALGALRPGWRSRSRDGSCETAGTRSAASSADRSATSGRATRSSASSSSGAQRACTSSTSAV